MLMKENSLLFARFLKNIRMICLIMVQYILRFEIIILRLPGNVEFSFHALGNNMAIKKVHDPVSPVRMTQ